MDLRAASKQVIKDFISIVYPPICELCKTPLGEDEELLCEVCKETLLETDYALCPVCGEHLDPEQERCPEKHDDNYVEFVRPLSDYNDDYKDLIYLLKNQRRFDVAKFLGFKLGEIINEEPRFNHYEALVPVPLYKTKRRERGYNQSEYLARYISQECDKPVLSKVVKKEVTTKSQKDLSREERKENVTGVFKVIEPSKIEGRDLIIVDDVCTTGSTAQSLAKELKENGSGDIAVVVVAAPEYTPGYNYEEIEFTFDE